MRLPSHTAPLLIGGQPSTGISRTTSMAVLTIKLNAPLSHGEATSIISECFPQRQNVRWRLTHSGNLWIMTIHLPTFAVDWTLDTWLIRHAISRTGKRVKSIQI